MEKNFKIEFNTFFRILALARWKLREFPTKDAEDEEDIETCEELQDFLLEQEEDFFKITPSNPF